MLRFLGSFWEAVVTFLGTVQERKFSKPFLAFLSLSFDMLWIMGPHSRSYIKACNSPFDGRAGLLWCSLDRTHIQLCITASGRFSLG
jgi:hypothetical protein